MFLVLVRVTVLGWQVGYLADKSILSLPVEPLTPELHVRCLHKVVLV